MLLHSGATYSTREEQRETILSALNEVWDWMEDRGYFAEIKVRVCHFGHTKVWRNFCLKLRMKHTHACTCHKCRQIKRAEVDV